MMNYRSLAVLLGAVALASCEKNAVQDITGDLPSARIKFFNFGVNAPGVNFYANDVKMTAISSTTGAELTTGVAYGAAGNGAFYSAIAPGQYALSGRIAAATDKDLKVSNLTVTIADGKSYSFFQSGFYNTTAKTIDGFVVEDPLPAMDYTVAYVRFVNASSTSSPLILSAKNTTTLASVPVGAAVAYKAAGAFTSLPQGVYDLSAAVSGSSTNVVTRTAVSFLAGRVYTIAIRGDATVTTGTAAPALDNTANR